MMHALPAFRQSLCCSGLVFRTGPRQSAYNICWLRYTTFIV